MRVQNNVIKKIAAKIAVAAFWVLVWWGLSLLIERPTFFPSPLHVFRVLTELLVTPAFWSNVILSLSRILLGLTIGCVTGVLLFFFASRVKAVSEVCKPILTLAKTVPIALFIMLLWLYFSKTKSIIPVIASAVTVVPIIWSAMTDADATADKKLLEMANCFAKPSDVFFYVRLPHLFPYMASAVSKAIGIAWKAGLTAEIICNPTDSVGQEIYTARADRASGVFLAWAVVVVAISIALDALLTYVCKKITFRPKLKRVETPSSNGQSFPLVFDRISKHYGDQAVLDGFSYVFPNGKVTAIVGQAGCGKTTLLSIAASLIHDDERKYKMPPTAAGMIFREDRLLPDMTVTENILFANRGANIKKVLASLALQDVAQKYPNELDDETRRRVAIGRAIAFYGGIGIFDEPFCGLDEDTKALCAQALFSAYKGKTVLFATSDEEDARRYADEILKIS